MGSQQEAKEGEKLDRFVLKTNFVLIINQVRLVEKKSSFLRMTELEKNECLGAAFMIIANLSVMHNQRK